MTPASPSVAVVGPGRAGTHIAAALSAAGWPVSLCGRGDPVPNADITVLAVRDGEIDAVARSLPGRLLVHLAGSRGATETIRLALHPVMTFPARAEGVVSLAGVAFAVSAADEDASAWARRVVDAVGGFVVEVPDGARSRYHAACALASNALVTLEESAVAALVDAGIGEGDARLLLGPLVGATAANWRRDGRGALSGPVVRGDHGTVDLHLGVLTGVAGAFYRAHVAAVTQ